MEHFSLAAVEFYAFIGLAVWLLWYQARSARRRREEYDAQPRAEDPRSGAAPSPTAAARESASAGPRDP